MKIAQSISCGNSRTNWNSLLSTPLHVELKPNRMDFEESFDLKADPIDEE